MIPLVCVILVNYNGYRDTRECVNSLKKCNYSNIKIIIVDNASAHGAVQYDDIITHDICRIVSLKENVGFAGGNNVGFEYARLYNPNYYLVLNNDTVVTKNFIQPLLKCFDIDTNIGIATGKILSYYEKDTVWYGGSYYDAEFGEHKIRGIGEKDSDLYNRNQQVDFATGCLWLIPHRAFETIGKMSEDYFLYYEDADYCMRVRQSGYCIYYVPESVIFHKESKSTGKGSNLYQYYNNRNYLLYIKKHHQKNRLIFYVKRAIRMTKGVIKGNMKLGIAVRVWKDFFLSRFGQSNIPL